MMVGVKIPLPSLSAALSDILKLQIDETQLKKDQKGNSFSFQPLSSTTPSHTHVTCHHLLLWYLYYLQT